MKPFVKETGVVAPLDRVNVDTDQIIPAEFLKRIERTGFGQFLFNSWRFTPDGKPDPNFELNDSKYQGATFLVTRRNFGSGSSREHAVWALDDYGFRALIGPSFADIFQKNCFENGLVPVILPEDLVDIIMTKAKEIPGYKLTVDLRQCEVSDGQGFRADFKLHGDPDVHEFRRECMLDGLDEISLTVKHEDKIVDYERRRGIVG